MRIVQYSVLALALVAIVATFSVGSGTTGKVTPAERRKAMPDFAMPDLRGQDWRLSAHAGRVTLLNFWATWCPPCREEIPGFIELARSEPNVNVIGIAMDEGGSEVVHRFSSRTGINYPILLPPASSPFFDAIQTLPTTFLIDKQGRIAKKYFGAVTETVVRRDLALLLGE